MHMIGYQIRKARKRLGLSQTDLGTRVGLSQQAIAKIERGDTRQPNAIPKFAKALNVSIAYLFSEDEPDRLIEEKRDRKLLSKLNHWMDLVATEHNLKLSAEDQWMAIDLLYVLCEKHGANPDKSLVESVLKKHID